MSIPDEAVEAASKSLRGHNPFLPDLRSDTDTPEDEFTCCARAALEAAVPYILADVWDEGRKHGARYPYGERGLATDDNPYRSAK